MNPSPINKPLVANETIKLASRQLRGSIAQDLSDTSTGTISKQNSLLTKFHGLYMQDDRDRRNALKAAGKEKSLFLHAAPPAARRSHLAATMAGA
jgi:sulfite reductase (NADPH) hemoprotein beta-component